MGRDILAIKAVKWVELMRSEYGNEISESVQKSVIYTPELINLSNIKHKQDTKVILRAAKSGAAISRYCQGKSAVLNFASFRKPGGGFLTGSIAQEEALCHESTLYPVLDEFEAKTDYYLYNRKMDVNSLYADRAIYSPDIIFVDRAGNKTKCDVITCAAPNVNMTVQGSRVDFLAENSEKLAKRVQFVMDIAAENRVEVLILGAFGCGVFRQEAREVASLFAESLTGDKKNVFRAVVFAIPDVGSYNYTAFRDVLQQFNLIQKLYSCD